MEVITIKYDPATGDVKLESTIDRPVLLFGVLEFTKSLVTRQMKEPGILIPPGRES